MEAALWKPVGWSFVPQKRRHAVTVESIPQSFIQSFILQRLGSAHFVIEMIQVQHGCSMDTEQSAWGPLSEKHISIRSNSNAISEISPALFHCGFRIFRICGSGPRIWILMLNQGLGIFRAVKILRTDPGGISESHHN